MKGDSSVRILNETSPKERDLAPAEKILRDRVDQEITAKAEQRDEHCWCWGCSLPARSWVREVRFDIKEDKANIHNAVVTSQDYPGAVPGFCFAHIGTGPVQLAETVYFSRPEMYWGFRPTRWFVIFTDGTKQGGSTLELDPKQLEPKIVEEYIPGDEK